MAKWEFTRTGGPFNYPTLGFTASVGDVLEADNAPDAWWESVASDTPATVNATAESSFVETTADAVLMYDQDRNEYTARTVSEARTALSVLSETELSAAYGATAVDLAGGNVTLATVARMMRLTGATAARTVTFPAGFLSCLVDNDTDYTITLKRSGATGSLTVDTGAVVELVGA